MRSESAKLENIWYYAEGNKPVGPASLADLTTILSNIPNFGNVLVWRHGFANWEPVSRVRELGHLVTPPPLPNSSPALTRNVFAPQPSNTVPSKAQTQQPLPVITKDGELVGIGGWLVLLAIGQILGPLKLLAGLGKYYSELESNMWTLYPITFYGEAVLNASLVVIVGYTTYYFFRKSRLFPVFFVYQAFASILLAPIDAIFGAATLSAYSGESISTIMHRMVTPEETRPWIAAVIGAAIWVPYVLKSKRVANTFVNV